MTSQERNKRIFEIHQAFPQWTYQEIGDMVGLSRQRVERILKQVAVSGKIEQMDETINNHRLNGEPISATQVARDTGIPYYVIADWVRRGIVKVLEHPGHACTGKPVLLDPVSLQERINRYRPHRRKVKVAA